MYGVVLYGKHGDSSRQRGDMIARHISPAMFPIAIGGLSNLSPKEDKMVGFVNDLHASRFRMKVICWLFESRFRCVDPCHQI